MLGPWGSPCLFPALTSELLLSELGGHFRVSWQHFLGSAKQPRSPWQGNGRSWVSASLGLEFRNSTETQEGD